MAAGVEADNGIDGAPRPRELVGLALVGMLKPGTRGELGLDDVLVWMLLRNCCRASSRSVCWLSD